MTRALMGISEAFYIPAALALIADVHRGSTRSRAVGFHQMGIYCGVIVGGFGGYAADHPGSRLALGLRGLRRDRDRSTRCRSSCCCAGPFRQPSRVRRRPIRQRPRPIARAGPGRARAPRQRLVPAARRLLHVAGPRRLDRPRLDAGDPQGGVRHRPGPRRRVRHALLAARGDRRRDRRRLARRSLDATQPARPHQHERAQHGVHRAGDVRRGLCARDRPAVGGDRVPDPVRTGLGDSSTPTTCRSSARSCGRRCGRRAMGS